MTAEKMAKQDDSDRWFAPIEQAAAEQQPEAAVQRALEWHGRIGWQRPEMSLQVSILILNFVKNSICFVRFCLTVLAAKKEREEWKTRNQLS